MIEDYDVYHLSNSEKTGFILIFLLFLVFIGEIFYGSWWPCILFIPGYRPVKNKYCALLAKKRKNMLRLQFKDMLYCLSSSFSTGRHMKEALIEARANLRDIYGEEGYIVGELDAMVKRMKEVGETDIQVFVDFSLRSGLEDIEDFTQVFRACRDTGGNLIKAFNKAAAVIGEKITIENEIKVMISQKKFEGKIITLMPVAIILFLRIMSPEYLEIMYTTLAGRLMMSIALGVTLVAYLMMERITAIEV